jgi:hypothetical protein
MTRDFDAEPPDPRDWPDPVYEPGDPPDPVDADAEQQAIDEDAERRIDEEPKP